MIIDTDVVTLSRLQFALTALYHFLFVPLTLGLVWMLAIMESVYVMTGREVWKRMVQFWGVLFGINFAMGVATGVTMEFQFGMNWAYYSHYVGDIFGAPLAIEELMAFFLGAALSVVVLGDASGYTVSLNQKMKMAAIEAMWHTEPAPASFTLIGLPNVQRRTTDYAVRIPWMMGLIGTRSLDQIMPDTGPARHLHHGQRRQPACPCQPRLATGLG